MRESALFLMTDARHFGVTYQINPWMRPDAWQADKAGLKAAALASATALRAALERIGARVKTVPAVADLPDLVFPANAAVVLDGRVLVARFRHPERQGEEEIFRAAFLDLKARGLVNDVLDLPEGVLQEGAGDALFCGTTLFAGYRIRSDAASHQWLGKTLSRLVLPLELVDPRFYHLDTCFCPIAPGQAIYFPDAFDRYGRRVLETHIDKLLPVVEAEAARFACNAVVVGKTVIVNAGSEQLGADLRAWGYEVVFVELDEFLKAGGSAKCLTLRLDGEDAAIWGS